MYLKQMSSSFSAEVERKAVGSSSCYIAFSIG